MKFKLKAGNRLLALALFAYAGAGFAATPTAQELQQQIEEVRNTISVLKNSPDGKDSEAYVTQDQLEGLRAALEDYKYDVQRNRDTKTALTKRGTTISGTVQFRANATSQGATSGAATTQSTPRSTSFDVPTANIAFTGSLFKDYAEGKNLDFKVGFGYAKASAATTSAAATSTFSLQDAYLQYNFTNIAVTGQEDPSINLRIGQQQTAFGLEAQTTDELKPSINTAQFVSGLGVGTRQTGVILRGDFEPYVDYGFNYRAPLLEYAVGLVNGNGPNQSDNNNRKDWLARLAFTAPVDYTSWLRELKFGVSAIRGSKNILAGAITTQADGTQTSTAVNGRSDRYGFDIYYNHLPYGFTYEYVLGKDDTLVTNAALPATAGNIATTNTGNIRTLYARGQTLTLFYTWGEQWLKSSNGTGQGKYDDWWPKTFQPFVRLDRWNPNTANDAASGTNVTGQINIDTVGFNFFFAETTKLQINVNRYDYKNPVKKDYRELQLQFQYGF